MSEKATTRAERPALGLWPGYLIAGFFLLEGGFGVFALAVGAPFRLMGPLLVQGLGCAGALGWYLWSERAPVT